MSDYVSGLRQDLVEAAARQQAAGRGARVARPLRPRAWSPVVVLGAAAALVAALVLVVGLRAVTPPRPPEAPKVVGGFHIEVQPSDAVAAGGYVIVSDYGGQLLQIDPRTEEQHQIDAQRRRSGGACRGRRHRVGRDREHRPGSPALDPGPSSIRRAAGGSPPSRWRARAARSRSARAASGSRPREPRCPRTRTAWSGSTRRPTGAPGSSSSSRRRPSPLRAIRSGRATARR